MFCREAQALGRGVQNLLQWLLLVGAHELSSSLGGPRPDPNRISRGWKKWGISSAGLSSRARVTALKLPPTHPMLAPSLTTEQKPSPGIQPQQCTKLGAKSRMGGSERLGINQHLNKH